MKMLKCALIIFHATLSLKTLLTETLKNIWTQNYKNGESVNNEPKIPISTISNDHLLVIFLRPLKRRSQIYTNDIVKEVNFD